MSSIEEKGDKPVVEQPPPADEQSEPSDSASGNEKALAGAGGKMQSRNRPAPQTVESEAPLSLGSRFIIGR